MDPVSDLTQSIPKDNELNTSKPYISRGDQSNFNTFLRGLVVCNVLNKLARGLKLWILGPFDSIFLSMLNVETAEACYYGGKYPNISIMVFRIAYMTYNIPQNHSTGIKTVGARVSGF